MSTEIAFLMYHEIAVPGRELCRDFKGHVPYAVPQREFSSQLDFLREQRWRSLSVSEALAANSNGGHASTVAITFDDGSETDLHTAAPLLDNAGFHATFYVIAGWLGRPGYMSASQLRELHARGFEIGCHSMTHKYLTGLTDRELRVEIADAKARLEEILGAAVNHLSCPGGFWSTKIARLAKLAGYKSVATSRVGRNSRRSDPYRLSRISIMRGMTLDDFRSVCYGHGLFLKQARERVAAIPKALLGANLYIRLHSALHRNETRA
jgi:peptidoglycan/xylan/chitin deacetylase (PgdA/CDA1 family)